MRNNDARQFTTLLVMLLTCAVSLSLVPRISPQSPATTNATPLSDTGVRQRADTLLNKMTLEEKIGQLTQFFTILAPTDLDDQIAKGKVGSILFATDPAQINHFQHLAVDQSRLHIPLIFGFDVIHGFRTIFPVPIAIAASWDPSVAVKEQTIAAKEASADGINWAFAPMLDIARDPRWGRMVEGAGEDPYLGSAMAAAQVRGFQGDYIGSPDHILACMKHFAGYGAAQGGRDYDEVYIPDTLMYNVYLLPFHAAVKAGVGSAMSAYMDLNDVPATGNRWLLTDVLRDQWKFQGFVVSDADAVKSLKVHGYAKDFADAAKRALDAGVDMEMALTNNAYSDHLLNLVQTHQVTEKQIDDSARRILEMKIRLGLFEHPFVDEAPATRVLADPAHRTASREVAERTAVLLRNEGNLLPVSKTAYKRVAVLGPLADSQIDTLGPWSIRPDVQETVTILAGIRNKLGSQVELNYAPGVQIARKFPSFFDDLLHLPPVKPWPADQAKDEMSKAVNLAGSSDLTVLVLGEAQNMIGEAASRESLDLPGQEEQLLENVVATGKPVVLLLMSGRPLNIKWAVEHVPSILEIWYPGTQGGNAVANLLFGDAVPGGKLPFAWPRDNGQIPINYAHNTTQQPERQNRRYWDEESTPLFPFGYGLSYSTFRFSNLKLCCDSLKLGETLDVTVDVENTGNISADEVAQLYIHQRYGSTSRPVRELKGFQRVTLAPHQKKTLHFTVGKDELSYWSTAKKSWTQESSTFDIWLGPDSTASLHSAFTVTE
ncbi:MAG TPA: beta-glucosidase BglX [Candidatus Sulfotelmatobacter sp.]|nr:beta-glucosidase BglX [Candidatus Sulfotelmatobacter sp.]